MPSFWFHQLQSFANPKDREDGEEQRRKENMHGGKDAARKGEEAADTTTTATKNEDKDPLIISVSIWSSRIRFEKLLGSRGTARRWAEALERERERKHKNKHKPLVCDISDSGRAGKGATSETSATAGMSTAAGTASATGAAVTATADGADRITMRMREANWYTK